MSCALLQSFAHPRGLDSGLHQDFTCFPKFSDHLGGSELGRPSCLFGFLVKVSGLLWRGIHTEYLAAVSVPSSTRLACHFQSR